MRNFVKEVAIRTNNTTHLYFQYTTPPWDLGVIQSKLLCRAHFGQYQVSPAKYKWLGDGDSYLVKKMQSGGWT